MKVKVNYIVEIEYSERDACANTQRISEGDVRRAIERLDVDNLRVRVTEMFS